MLAFVGYNVDHIQIKQSIFGSLQAEKQTALEFSDRTNRLAEKLGISVRQLADVLEMSLDPLMGGRTGRLPVSRKTWKKLRDAEAKHGLDNKDHFQTKQNVLNEPAAVYKAAGNAAGDKPKIQADRLKINTAFRTAPAEPTAEDCISYLAAYVSRARLVPGMIGHTWIQLKRHFPIEDLEQLDDSGPKQLG